MTVSVEHSAYPWRERHVVFVERRVFRNGRVTASDRKALTPEDAMRLARIIRDQGSDYGLFDDALTGEEALSVDFAPCEYHDLTWRRPKVRDATESLWDADWPEAFAYDLIVAAREAME